MGGISGEASELELAGGSAYLGGVNVNAGKIEKLWGTSMRDIEKLAAAMPLLRAVFNEQRESLYLKWINDGGSDGRTQRQAIDRIEQQLDNLVTEFERGIAKSP